MPLCLDAFTHNQPNKTMSKPKSKPTQTTTTDANDNAIPTLEAITGMAELERLTLYRRCDEQMRSRFLIQGKILHATEGGEEALRHAGIPRSSLYNAKMAAIALELTTMDLQIHHDGAEAPFTEAIYDTLTLEQCRLLAHGSTGSGQVKHRPLPATFYDIIKGEAWWDELEHYFEHGMTRAAKKAMEEEAAQRAAMLERIDIPAAPEMGAEGEAPAAPVIVSVPEPKAEGGGAKAEGEETPGNVVPFTQEGGREEGAPQAPPVLTVVEPEPVVLPPEQAPTPSFKDITDHLGALEEMIAHMDPVVCASARQELADRLRAMADKLVAAPVTVSVVETPAPAKKGKKRAA